MTDKASSSYDDDDDAIIDENGNYIGSRKSKFLGEVFSDEKLEYNQVDLFNASEAIAEWAFDEEPIDPSICRFYGLLLMSIAESVETKE